MKGNFRFSDTYFVYMCVHLCLKHFLTIAYLFQCILCESIHVKKKSTGGKFDPVLLVSIASLLLVFNDYIYAKCFLLKRITLYHACLNFSFEIHYLFINFCSTR